MNAVRKQICKLCNKNKLYIRGLYYSPITATFILKICNYNRLANQLYFTAELLYNKRFRKLDSYTLTRDFVKVCLNCVYIATGWVCTVHRNLLLKYKMDRQREYVSIMSGEFNEYATSESIKLLDIEYLEKYINFYSKENKNVRYFNNITRLNNKYGLDTINIKSSDEASIRYKKALSILADTCIKDSRLIRGRPDWDILEDSGEIGFTSLLQIFNKYELSVMEEINAYFYRDIAGIIIKYC